MDSRVLEQEVEAAKQPAAGEEAWLRAFNEKCLWLCARHRAAPCLPGAAKERSA